MDEHRFVRQHAPIFAGANSLLAPVAPNSSARNATLLSILSWPLSRVGPRRCAITALVKPICLAAILVVSPPLKPQSFYGSILGTVTDSSGAVVPDATVTVTNIGTNEVQRVPSNAEGNYSTVNLVPATYNVEVTKASFRRFLSDQVTIGRRSGRPRRRGTGRWRRH